MDRSLTVINAKESYMQISLLKKYYKLARCLIKYHSCRNYLNFPPPDSDEYLVWITKLEMKKRRQMIDKIRYTKDITNEQTKILDFIKSYSNNEEFKASDNKENDEVIYQEKPIETTESNKNRNEIDNEEESHFSYDSNILCLNSLKKDQKIETQLSHAKYLDLQDQKTESNQVTTTANMIENVEKTNRVFSLPKISSEKIMGKINNPLGAFSQFFKQNIFHDNANNKKRNQSIMNSSSKKDEMKTRNSCNLPEVGVTMYRQPFVDEDMSKFHLIPKSTLNTRSNPNYELDNYTPKDRKSVLNNSESYNITDLSHSLSTIINKEQTWEIISLDKIKKGQLHINIQLVLVEQLRIGEFACDCLCLLSSMKEKRLSSFYLNKIFSYLLYYTINEEAISKCPEPLLFIALAGEFLVKLGEKNLKIIDKAKTVLEEILSLGQKLQSSMKDEDMLNYYLKDQYDHLGRNALEIIAVNKFFSLLDVFEIGTIVKKIWSGEERSSDLFKFLRMTKILQTSIFNEEYASTISITYTQGDIYNFQYSQYTQNCSVRYLIDSFLIGFIAVIYEYAIYNWIMISKNNYKLCIIYQYLGNCLLSSSILNFGVLVLFLNLTKRQSRVALCDIVITILMLILLLFNFIGLPHKIFNPSEESEDYFLMSSILFSLIIILSWSKVISILMTTYLYGPFLRIMLNVFFEILRFMIIVICITFLFAQVFTLFFQNSNVEFNEFFNGFITLFNTAFGQINFDSFTSLDIFGYICLILYSTLSNIMLFNLIVVIINNLFNNLQNQVDSESRSVLIITHERIKWDNNYGLLILLPAPLNIFAIPFIIILLCCSRENTAFFNTLFSKICYTIIAMAYFILLFIVGILAYPFTLIKAIIHICYDAIQPNCTKRLRLLTSLLYIPCQLWWFFIQDLYQFWLLVYKPNLPLNDLKPLNEFTKEYVVALRKVLNDLRFKEQKKTITINELYKKMSLFKNKHWYRKTIENKKLGVNSNSLSDNISSDSSSINQIKTNNANIITMENNESEKELTKMIREETKMKFRLLIDKIVDPEGIIDIERSLIILPSRIKYSQQYFQNLKYLNIRVLLRGARKNAFINDNNNWRYSFRRLQLLIYKILIKFRMLYSFVPCYLFKEALREVNLMEQFQKNNTAFLIYENRDNASEYDDEGECLSTLDLSTNDKNSKITLLNIKSITDSNCSKHIMSSQLV